MQEFENLISKIVLFKDLSKADCSKIDKLCGWAPFKTGHEILHQDDPSTDVFFIASGAVSAKSFSPGGKEVTYFEFEAGEMFGEFSAIDGQMRSATVITTAPSLIGRLEAEQFQQVIKGHPELGMQIAAHLVAKIRNLSTRIYEFSTLAVRQRLHAELLRMCKTSAGSNTGVIEVAPTHYEMATHISTHREAVSREMSRLISIGLLSAHNGSYVVRDVDKLTELVVLAGLE